MWRAKTIKDASFLKAGVITRTSKKTWFNSYVTPCILSSRLTWNPKRNSGRDLKTPMSDRAPIGSCLVSTSIFRTNYCYGTSLPAILTSNKQVKCFVTNWNGDKRTFQFLYWTIPLWGYSPWDSFTFMGDAWMARRLCMWTWLNSSKWWMKTWSMSTVFALCTTFTRATSNETCLCLVKLRNGL